jgi:hypothetical protein
METVVLLNFGLKTCLFIFEALTVHIFGKKSMIEILGKWAHRLLTKFKIVSPLDQGNFYHQNFGLGSK